MGGGYRKPVPAILQVLLLAVLGVAGCSGDKEGPAATDASLEARAKRAVLKQSDLPEGWAKGTGTGLAAGHEQAWVDIRDCIGAGEEIDAGAVRATSGPFESGGARVESIVTYVNAEQASGFALSMASLDAVDCGREALAAEAVRDAPQGETVARQEVAPLSLPRLANAASWAARSTTTYSSGPVVVTDVVVLISEGALCRLAFVNEGGPFPQDLQQSLIEKVVSRA